MERQFPKNVRQIGNVCDEPKIYVEDYVDTYLNQLRMKAMDMPVGAVFTGEIQRVEEQDVVYISGALQMKDLEIKGTDIPIENIINRTEENGGYHNYLWVQMDRPGAEEWVRGYVAHFGQMGVKFLRVDFLSWYEDGYDIGYGTVGPDRPDWMYPTALRWMREECDKYGMILSLVMACIGETLGMIPYIVIAVLAAGLFIATDVFVYLYRRFRRKRHRPPRP